MRVLPPGLKAHLDSGATTLCHCWRLETPAGVIFGFTDHDRNLTFDGVTYEAEAGFAASEIESSLGLAIDNLEASGALSSSRLTEERLKAGDFDNAKVEVWRVNWQDVSQRLLLRTGNLGEVTYGTLGFTAEVRGLAHQLNQPKGRFYQFGCDASLGDSRCTVDLENSAYKGSGAVLQCEDNRRIGASGLSGFSVGWFARGTLTWTNGANLGRVGQVKFHRVNGSEIVIELWQQTAYQVSAGDQFEIRAGCDKQFTTCKAKFANGINYRGFPQIPGDDFVLTYARRDDPANDGGSRE